MIAQRISKTEFCIFQADSYDELIALCNNYINFKTSSS